MFRDSYLILNASLENLCNSFNVDIKKCIFPYNFLKVSKTIYLCFLYSLYLILSL